MQYKCTGIILKTTKLGEADKILSIYSPELGLVRAVAKSARKANNSFGSKAQVLSYCDFLIGKGRNLDIVSQAKLLNDFRHLRKNYEALTFSCFFLDILENITVKDEHYDENFELLMHFLESLDALAKAADQNFNLKFYVLVTHYLWDLINGLGYKPNLDSCSITHKSKHPKHIAKYYDFENGGITSTAGYEQFSLDSPYQDYIRPINSEVYKILYSLYSKQELETNSDTSLKSAIKLLHKHLEFRIHKEFKTWKLLEPILS